MMAAETPLTGVAWAAAPEAAPAGWTAITVTVEGAAANLGKGFGHKGGGYLCVCTGGAQAAPGPVVTDLQVLSDRSPQPPGYTRIPEFPEARTGFSRKKRVYMKLLPLDTAETAVFDLKLSSKSKALPHYMKIGEIGNFAIWCKKGPVLKSKVQPISEGLKQLSLQPPDSDHKSPVAQCSIKRASQHESLYDTSNIYGLSAPGMFLKQLSLLFPAMDGVPFTLHPKFESKLSSGSNAILADLNVKSLADIEKEYNYAFVVERTAAARLPPSVC
ncbi:multivesicular body subunit 12A isoform X3 [Accipiter gentilis]|uniref:multivesicular body subunit 12A isoform X3 n=1 Tax=Astur gentilis TaxID=8957 RepID=UPI00210F7FCF|nr:multivesicular body subunit 12A isoform X3 [Accipiter gentilis]